MRAEQNEPFQPNSVLQVDTYYETGGFAHDLAISDSLLFVAANQVGFSIFNRLNGQKISNYYDTFENARLIDYVERDSLLFIYDRYGDFAGIGNIYQAPEWNKDFSLTQNSPCVDAGIEQYQWQKLEIVVSDYV
ncbi:MAG: hypothetical protein SVM86_07590 [Candidatus Cloacimonadota bacterium]|nr:hypothetical protein [Candidatus Cloacimonadota bacterium]